MNAKHTPGPWYACGDEVLIDMGDRAHLIATAADWSEETEPNAHLISAAPEMLDQLRRLVANAEQSAFETWLAKASPSGAVEEVQHQWESSLDFAEFTDEWGEAKDAIAKATTGDTP